MSPRPPPSPGRWCLKGPLLESVGRLLSLLPPAAVPRMGGLLAKLRPLLRRRRHVASRNLALCFPQMDNAARTKLLENTMVSGTTGMLDGLRGLFAPTGRLKGLADIEGLEHLQAAQRAGDGAVVVSAHFDSILLAMRLVVDACGQPMPILVRRTHNPCVEASIDAARRRHTGMPYDQKDVSGFCGAVHAGEVGFYVPDQNAKRRIAFVPFFGVQAATFDAIQGVLQRAGGKLLLMWCRRTDTGRFVIDLRPAPVDFLDGDSVEVATRYTAWVQSRVLEAPEQYFWIHRRFRTRPAGEPDVYSRDPVAGQ